MDIQKDQDLAGFVLENVLADGVGGIMQNAKTYSAKDHGFLVGVLGTNTSGKSTFIRSAVEWALQQKQKACVLLSPSSELDSYSKLDVDYEMYMDEMWRPSQDQWSATAWRKLLTDIYALYDSEYRVIGFDTGSSMFDLGWHECMKLYRTEDANQIKGNNFAPYMSAIGVYTEFLQATQVLAARGKYVITAWHVEAKESEGTGTPSVSAGELRWDEQLLPSVRGKMKTKIAGYHSLWTYANCRAAMKNSVYELHVMPDKYRPARVRSGLELKDGIEKLNVTNVNGFTKILEALA